MESLIWIAIVGILAITGLLAAASAFGVKALDRRTKARRRNSLE